MNEEQFQIRQLHPTEDPELDSFPVKDLVTVGGFILQSLQLFCKFEIISKYKVKKKKNKQTYKVQLHHIFDKEAKAKCLPVSKS